MVAIAVAGTLTSLRIPSVPAAAPGARIAAESVRRNLPRAYAACSPIGRCG